MVKVRTVCNFCQVRCPTLVDVQDDRVVRLEADDQHPYGGLMCVKGKAAGELVEHPERLLYPLKRVSPKTAPPEWQQVSWDEALREIAARLLETRERDGAETIVFSKGTRSGTGLMDAERWMRRLANALGTPNTISTTHLCQWPRDEGTRYTFGARMPWPDLERSGCLLLWGCNPSATNIYLAHDIQQARRRGMKLVTVDPRRVGTAAQSDLHLAVMPGTDGALALGLAHLLVESGDYDSEFVRDWTNAPLLVRQDSGQLLRWSEVAGEGQTADGYVAWAGSPVRYDPPTGEYDIPAERLELEAAPRVRLPGGESVAAASVFHLLRVLLRDYPPERAEELTTVPADQIRAAAELLAQHRPAAHYFWNGITQHTNAAQNGRAISVLYGLLGDFDAPGGNVLSPKAPLNAVELNRLLSKEQVERRLGWAERPLGAPRTAGNSAAYDLYDAVLGKGPYRPRALLAFGTNMVMTNGGTLEGRAALEQLDFMVYVDYFMTPTAELADYVLPAATFLEAPTLIPGWEYPVPAQTHLQYRTPAIPPRGEVRSDAQIIFDLAVHLGLGEVFWQGNLDAAFEHELEPSGISLDELRSHAEGAPAVSSLPTVGGRGYMQVGQDGVRKGFATPTRKVELFATAFAQHGQDPLPRYRPPRWSPQQDGDELATEFPLVLTNAKLPQFCHGQHRGLPSLRRARPHPQVELHPDTAAQAGVADRGWVSVETPEGAIRVQARVNRAIKPGVVVGQHGWWQACAELGLPAYPPYSPQGANVNLLVSNDWRDPISGGTPHRSARCRLRPMDENEVRGSMFEGSSVESATLEGSIVRG